MSFGLADGGGLLVGFFYVLSGNNPVTHDLGFNDGRTLAAKIVKSRFAPSPSSAFFHGFSGHVATPPIDSSTLSLAAI